MEKLGINLGQFTVYLANFIIVMLVLTAWAYEPIVKILNDRKHKIAQGLEDARVAAEARASAEKDAAKIVAEAQAEANKRIAEATARASKSEADMRGSAEEERKRLIEAAKEEAMQERTRMLGDLRGQVAALAMAAAGQIVKESLLMNKDGQRTLIDEFFSGVKAGKVVVLEGGAAGGNAAEVTSAMKLSDSEMASIKQDLKASDVAFKVDPAILGGLVLRVGDKVVDGSVAGKMEGLRTSLK